MGLRNIIKKGDPSLLKKSREVTNFDARRAALLDDMRETLLQANGLGLAAPQVGVLRRVCLVIETNTDPEEIIELIKPVIVESEGEQTDREGCLSLPGERQTVRFHSIIVRWLNLNMQPQKRSFEGYPAQIIQHECDHLEGIVI